LWRDGHAGTNAAELADVARALAVENVENAINSDDVKGRLRANTDAALAVGVFGVPTLRIGHELFWGNDASEMVEDWLANPVRFESEEYRRIANLPLGVQRRR
jgi:2-hydroxychromene-2-carboxylate isomerase